MTKFPIPDAALDDRLGFTGTAGSGKTYNACAAVERILDRHGRVVIPDPLGVWWGLRLMPDGKTPSPYRMPIFGGPHGDLPLNEQVGALIGETVAGMAESCIIDLSDLGTKAAERRFMLAFLTAFYRHTKGEPVHIVFDEADMWSPQRLMDKDGDAARLLGMMETIVRRGRVKGFIPWLITQRPAVVSKDVLSQVDGLVSFKLTSSQDRAAIGAWIEGQADQQQGKAILASLPTMQRGQGVVWVPGRGILDTASFPLKKTFDSSRTPKRGEKKASASLAPLDLDSLKERLSSVEAEAKENDPKALKTQIRELEKKLAQKPAPAADPQELDRIQKEAWSDGRATGYREGYHGGYVKAWDEATAELEKARHHSNEAAGILVGMVMKREQIDKYEGAIDIPAHVAQRIEPRNSTPKVAGSNPAVRSTPAQEGMSGPAQRILDALAELEAIGAKSPPRIMVANLSGYGHPQSTGFVKALGALRTAAQIDYGPGGTVFLTDAGRAIASANGAPASDAELHERIKVHLSGPGQKILDAVVAAYPGAISREDLARAADYNHVQSTGFVKALGRLRTFGFVDYRPGSQVVALPVLFIEGK